MPSTPIEVNRVWAIATSCKAVPYEIVKRKGFRYLSILYYTILWVPAGWNTEVFPVVGARCPRWNMRMVESNKRALKGTGW